MAKTENLHTRVEPELKKEAERILSDLGIPISCAIDMFYKQIVLRQGIPFDMKLPGPNIPNLYSDKIDEALEKGWQDMLSGRTIPARDAFAQLRGEYGIE